MTDRFFAARAVTATISLGLALLPCAGADAAPFAYVTNTFSDSVSVVDTATNAVVATIPVGNGPQGVAVNAAGTRVYVANGDSPYGVSVIDTATNSVIDTFPVISNPGAIVVRPDGRRLYVGLSFSGKVSVFDTDGDANTFVTNVTVAGPVAMAAHPDGTRIYIASDVFPNTTLSVLDTATNTVSTTIPMLAKFPRGVAVNNAGTRVYVTGFQLIAGLNVVDATTNTLITAIPLPGTPTGVAVTPDDTRVYVTNNSLASVAVIDAASNTAIDSIPLGAGYPTGVRVTPNGAAVYVAQSQPSYLRVIGTRCDEVDKTVALGELPNAIAFGPGPAGPALPPPVPLTTHVTAIEVTQAIQNVANDVPLIIGKRAFARVYVEADGAAVAGVTATLSGLGSYTSGGGSVSVPLGPLTPSNANGPRITVGSDPKRANGDDSFLFELPYGWTLFEGLRLHAELSAPNAAPATSCARDVASAPLLEFRRFTTLKVAFVRMGYQLPGVFANPADALAEASSGEQRDSESWMRRAFPVSQLTFAPDLVLFDPFLGAYVDQSDPFCKIALPVKSRNLCAQRYVSARLAALAVSTSFMDGADVAYGLIPQPNPNPNKLFTRGACCNGIAGAGPANDDDYTAHEIGHFLGRKHPVPAASECEHSPDDPNYPYFFSFIAPPLSDPNTDFAGFDVGDPGLFKPLRFLPPRSTFDIMGYCGPPTWISDYTYGGLLLALQALHPDIGVMSPSQQKRAVAPKASAPQPGDWLLVFGAVAADLGSAMLMDTRRVDQVFSVPPRPLGDFSIRLLDDVGGQLASYSFAPVADEDAGEPGVPGAKPLSFGHAVPFVAGTRELRIVHDSAGGAVLATTPVSGNAPIVGTVTADGPDPGTGAVALAWTATDADDDALRYDVYATRNNGASVMPLRLGLTTASADIDTGTLGGGSVQFRVVASDGIQTGHAASAPVLLPNKPPKPRILLPGAQSHVWLGQVVNLQGEAADLQDGALPDAGLAWSTELGPIGTGANLSVSNLPVGTHTLTLTATDSLALSAAVSVKVTVDGNFAGAGPTLTAGPGQYGWHVAAGETQLQFGAIEIGNSGSGTLQFAVSSGAAWLTPGVLGGTAPATLQLTADPAGLTDGHVLDTTLVLTAVGQPDQAILIPVRISMGDTFDAGVGNPPIPLNAILRDGFE